jgi:UPF0271 protein
MLERIDLNSDLGEGFGPWAMGDDAALLDLVSSANIACGGHASDPDTMYATLALARDRGVVVGAHPGYADPLGFGRRIIPMATDAIGRMIAAQIGALQGVAALADVALRYVKLHGALANLAADDVAVAKAVVQAVAAFRGLAVLAISGTVLEQVARDAGLPVYSEIFADRAYLANGRLAPRTRPDAVLHDADAAVQRLLRFLDSGLMPSVDGPAVRLQAHSVCVHGDSPDAVRMARHLRDRLQAQGVTIAPFLAG